MTTVVLLMVMRVVMLVLLLSEVVEGWSMAVASGSGMGGGRYSGVPEALKASHVAFQEESCQAD